jgi:hypothetical protein
MTQFWCANGPAPTTASFAAVTTGTAIKTMLQVETGANNPIKVKAWGISFDGSAAATPIACELMTTGTVAATVTAHVAAGVQPWGCADSTPVSTVALGTAATGYTASAEGTITTSTTFDLQFIAPTSQYVMMFPLGDEPMVGAGGEDLRIRVDAAAAVNCYCWVRWEE